MRQRNSRARVPVVEVTTTSSLGGAGGGNLPRSMLRTAPVPATPGWGGTHVSPLMTSRCCARRSLPPVSCLFLKKNPDTHRTAKKKSFYGKDVKTRKKPENRTPMPKRHEMKGDVGGCHLPE
jgi:hypothetical protein